MKIIQKAVIKKDETYLVLRRASNALFFPEYWDFPGGKLEEGEDSKIGIQREVKEEINLDVKAGSIIGEYNINLACDGIEVPHKFVVYEVSVLSDLEKLQLSSEHTAFDWITKDEILQRDIEPYIKLFFQEEKKEQIIEYLKTVMDPELHVDIWSMGLVREIDIRSEDSVYIKMTLTSPTCPLGPEIVQDIRGTLGKIGYTTVSVELTFDPPWEAPENFRVMLGF